MWHKFTEELQDDKTRYKSFNFQKSYIQNGISRNSSTKFRSVKNTSNKKLVVPEAIDLSDTIYANGKFMTEEMPKYVDANNSKEYLRNFIYNLNYSSSETDQDNTPKVTKKQTENFSRKVYNAEQSKIQPSKLKSKIFNANNNRDASKSATKSQFTKNSKKNDNSYGKSLKKVKNSVENLRGNVAKQKAMYYDDKTIRVIKKPNNTNQFGEQQEKCNTASSIEQRLNGYIQKLIRKFEDSPNDEISPYMLPPKRRNSQKNYKSKTTIVTPAETNELLSKPNLEKKNSQQNGTSVMAKAKILNDVMKNSKNTSKSNVAHLKPKTASKTEQDYYSPRPHAHNITKFHDFSKTRENRVGFKMISKTEKNEVNRSNFVPHTSPPVTRSKNKEERILSKTERNEVTRDDSLPYTSPPLTSNKGTKQNSAGKTSSIPVLPEKKKSLPEETKVSENKISKCKIIASKAISHAVENKSSDAKCSPLPQKKLSKIKDIANEGSSHVTENKTSDAKCSPLPQKKLSKIKDIANEGSSHVTENKTSDLKNSSMNKTQLSEIKELFQVIANEGSSPALITESSSPKCLPVYENKQSDDKIQALPKVAESKGSLKDINLEESNKKEKCTARTSLVPSKPVRALSMQRNPDTVYPRPIKSISWTSLAVARSALDITKINHRMPKSYVCSKKIKQNKNATRKTFKEMPDYVPTKKSSLTFMLTYKDTLFHISSSIFHSSISVPSIKENKNLSNNSDIIVKSNSQDAIELFKFSTNLNQTIKYKDDLSSIIQLFAPDKKINQEAIDENEGTFEISKKFKKKTTKKECCGHNTVVLCQRRPEYWWFRAQMRNDSQKVKRCNCDYCKTMSKYLPQIENSATSLSTSSENSDNDSSESVSLDVDSFRKGNSSYENIVKIDPLYTKLMADTQQNKFAQLLKYEPHSCCYSFNCEICRNTLRNIANCRTNRSETDLNLISKLKDHKHEITSNHEKNRYDINRSSDSRRNIFRKIKISTTRILTNRKVVETALNNLVPKGSETALAVVKTPAIKENSETKEIKVFPKIYCRHNVTVPIKPALKGGDMKLMDLPNTKSSVLIKNKTKKSSITIFSELRDVFTMFVSLNFKILEFITFGKLNVFNK